MKQTKWMAVAMAGLLGLAALPGRATADGLSDVSVSGDIGVVSQYVWRGLPQSIDAKGSSNPAVQGDVSLGLGGLSISGWFSNSYPSPAPQTANKTVTEFDWTLDYSGNVGNVGYSVGGIYYTYLYDSASNFAELYAGVSYDAVVSPSVTVYYNPKDSHNKLYLAGDTWIDVGLSSSLGGFDLSATASWAIWKKDAVKRAETVTGSLKSGLSLLTLSMSRDFKADGVTITPSLTATIPLGKKAVDGNRYIYNTLARNEVIFGVNLGW